MFQEMCIMSGCDYIASIKRIGIKKAYVLINHYRSIESAVRHLRREGKLSVPEDYEEEAEKALLTFQYQMVFDSETEKIVHMKELPSFLYNRDLSFLGRFSAFFTFLYSFVKDFS